MDLTNENDLDTEKESYLEGEDGLDFESEENGYPNTVVKVSRDQYSAFEAKRMVEEHKDLLLAPEFQRKGVWTLEQKRELIESMLMGIPIPVIYVFENENGIKQMVDGRQRVSTIIDFMNDKFKLDKLNMLKDFNGLFFSQLEPTYKSKLERYQLLVYVIEPPTPERVKIDIFDRVNRGGTRLNNQEMRYALYNGPITSLLDRLSKSEAFIKATGGAIKPKRMRDSYVILRFLAFYCLRTKAIDIEYKGTISDFLADAMKKLNNPSNSILLEKLEGVFVSSMSRSYEVLGKDGFRFSIKNINKRPINMPLFEALTYFFAIADLSSFEPNSLKEKLEQLKTEFDASDHFDGRVDTTTSVNYRFDKVESAKEKWSC